MHISLISADPELHALCGDVLENFPGLEWRLTPLAPCACPPPADLYIWDDHGRITAPPDLDQTWLRHLFVVHRDDLSKHRERPDELSAAAILLKPVKRESLSAFLGLAAAAHDRLSRASWLRADRDEILQCLIQSNLQIQKHDQDRANFLARAVHDFRAPLMSANGYCGLLLSEAVGPENEEQKEVLRRMQHSIQRLSRIASAMFDLSVGKQIQRDTEFRSADIRECIERALQEISAIADAKRISISVNLENEIGPLVFETGKIEQVLINLLENACKFTPKTGKVEIQGYPHFWERRRNYPSEPLVERRLRRSHEPNSYRIDIRDSGPRIAPEDLPDLFEEYTSYAGGPDRSGGGLSLAICKMILNWHGGRVWAENSESGPRFSFVLPVWRPEAVPAGHVASGSVLAEGSQPLGHS